jgi:hypothetical protein
MFLKRLLKRTLLNLKFLKNTSLTLVVFVALANSGFYLAETMTGRPIFANTLKVLGFCPAPKITLSEPILTNKSVVGGEKMIRMSR